MAEANDELKEALREVRDASRALADEVAALRQVIQDTERIRRRLALSLVIVLFAIPALACAGLGITRLIQPREESPWERQQRQQQEQLDRTNRMLDRGEKLLERWEKAAPRK